MYDAQTLATVYSLNGIVSSNCRCAWVPAVTESDEQKRSAAEIEEAFAESGLDVDIDPDRPRLNAAMDRLSLAMFCRTGPGGGVDATCGRGGSAVDRVAELYGGAGQHRATSVETIEEAVTALAQESRAEVERALAAVGQRAPSGRSKADLVGMVRQRILDRRSAAQRADMISGSQSPVEYTGNAEGADASVDAD